MEKSVFQDIFLSIPRKIVKNSKKSKPDQVKSLIIFR